MNHCELYKNLLGNSQSAMMAAIEIYNKPAFQYRDECIVILLLNSWELILKALISKNKESIFYQEGGNTLSWRDAFSKGANYFPSTISPASTKQNLEFLSKYRNDAVHFYNQEGFRVVLYSLAQTSIVTYRDLLLDSFDVDLSEQISWQLLPIGIRPPIDAISYISETSTDRRRNTEVRQYLSELAEAAKELTSNDEDTGRLLTIFNIKLESVRKKLETRTSWWQWQNMKLMEHLILSSVPKTQTSHIPSAKRRS